MIRSLSFEFANVIYNIFQKPSEETSELKKGVRKIRWMMSIPSKIKTLGHVLDFLSTRGGGAIVWTDIMWAGRQHNWQARKEFPARSCHYHHSLQYVHAGDRMNPSIFIAQQFTRSFFSNFKLLTRLPQEAEWMNESFRMANNLKKKTATNWTDPTSPGKCQWIYETTRHEGIAQSHIIVDKELTVIDRTSLSIDHQHHEIDYSIQRILPPLREGDRYCHWKKMMMKL